MVSKFAPGDFVRYRNVIYKVKTVILMNPDIISDPFVCGLVSLEKSNNYKQLLVREGLLIKVDPPVSAKITEVLYVERDKTR